MLTLEGSPVWVYDLEVFNNYFLATFYNGKEWRTYENAADLSKLLHAKNIIFAGFNNLAYDDVLLCEIAKNPTISNQQLFDISGLLIRDESKEVIFGLKYQRKPWRFSIDVFQLLNAKGSLKEWECKRGANVVSECPCDFNEPLDLSRVDEVRIYCRNDVIETFNMLKDKWELVTLRTKLKEMYGLMDSVYTMSEQGVAQHTFLTLHRNRTGENSQAVRQASQLNPDNIRTVFGLSEIISTRVAYKTPEFNTFLASLEAGMVKRETTWKLNCPNIGDEIELANRKFAFGVGGIHSIDGPAIYESDDDNLIVDLDVASYYPSIIINENLYPKHMGHGFVDDMRSLRDERLKAKRNGDTVVANALKIVVNATFGKLDDAYSPIRSAIDAKRVTINGQLFILMLVESLHMEGAEIVSANTDGVTIKWSRLAIANKLDNIINEWQTATGYELERVDYSKYIRRDINNYIAVTVPDKKGKSKIKLKGCFEPEPMGAGKWDGMVIKKAAVNFFTKGIPVAQTIESESDPRKFLFYQRTKKSDGILCFDKKPIGKSLRWYAAIMGGEISRYNPNAKQKKDGTYNYYTTIPHGESAMLAMDITQWSSVPCDVDRQHYIDEAYKLIRSVDANIPLPIPT